MKNNKNEKLKDKIIRIVLIVIIIILLVHNCCIIKDLKNNKKPKGNIEIIEINCDNDDTCAVDDKDKDKDSDKKDNNGKKNNQDIINNNSKENTLPINGNTDEPSEDNEDDGLIVKDKEITWNGSTKAKIFTNSMYELDDKIAPESSNTYQFVVKNATDYNLKYNISFTENNPFNINMKYKLRKNNSYIIDHYVSPNEINVSNVLLDIGKNDTYYLEWKWVSSDNDTEIGSNPNAVYELKIDIKAESING